MDSFIKRTITVCVSLFLIAYVGYQCYTAFYNPVKTEQVTAVSEYQTVDTEGFAIRNEKLITGDKKGYLYYTVDNGSRVSKSGIIARVYPTEADSRSQHQLNGIVREIEQLKDIQNQGTAGKVNLEVINKQVQNKIGEMKVSVNSPVVRGINELQFELLGLLNKRQFTIGQASSFENRINELNQLKNQLVSTFSVSTANYKSPVAGYFVSKADGFEQTVDFDKVNELTVEKLRGLINSKNDVLNVIGKVVGDYKWYLACIVPVAEAGELRQGSQPDILLPFVTDDVIPSSVVAVNRSADGNVAVVFECSYMSSELSSIRQESVQIRLRRYEGLRIPSYCIVTNDENQKGVYVLSGGRVMFRRVEVIHAMPNYIICKQIDKTGYLKLYDDLIVEGKGLYDGKAVG